MNADFFWKIFWKQIVQQNFIFQNQFYVKTCCVVKISDQNLTCGKKDVSKFDMLQRIPIPKKTNCLKLTENPTYFEILDSRLTRCWKPVSKSVSFLKVLIQKLFFFLFFSISWFLRNRITEENGVFAGWKGRKVIFCKQIFHQNLFLNKSSSLQNVICCKTFFSKSDTF